MSLIGEEGGSHVNLQKISILVNHSVQVTIFFSSIESFIDSHG